MAQLARRLGTTDAVVIGLSAMVGAGVFAAFPPAAESAGPWLLVGLGIAAVVAWCNASSSAALASRYPEAGGTYVYGRERLGPFWGYLAGWGFVVGKTASCAAMALTAATYLVPVAPKPAAAGFALVLLAVNYVGITRTARLAAALLVVTLTSLAVVLVGIWLGGTAPAPEVAGSSVAPWGVLQSAGLLFFAFAGYARIATLGEEVRDPARTLPRAIPLALGLVVVLYACVAVTLLATLGPQRLADTLDPLAAALRSGSLPWLAPVAVVGAGVGALGALLALIAGVGRTTMAMAREGDLPTGLAVVHPRFRTPHRAELAVAAGVIALVLVVDLRGAIGFSSFGVLVYYAVANASALTLTDRPRWLPRAVPTAGLAGCVLLCVTLPASAVLGGTAVFAVGIAAWWLRRRQRG